MPKFKVKISLASFEEIVDAPDENTAQNIAEEDYFRYIMNVMKANLILNVLYIKRLNLKRR